MLPSTAPLLFSVLRTLPSASFTRQKVKGEIRDIVSMLAGDVEGLVLAHTPDEDAQIVALEEPRPAIVGWLLLQAVTERQSYLAALIADLMP